MKTSSLNSNAVAVSAPEKTLLIQKGLLFCGIFSSILYVVANSIGAATWPGYSMADMSISELIGIDAPSAPVTVPLFFIYSLLVYAFGLGVWMSAGQKRALRITAVLITLKEVLGMVGLLVAPVHMRGVEPGLSDTLHIIVTAVGTLLCIFPALLFSARAFGRKFLIYTIFTAVIFLVFGAWGGSFSAQLAANLPTPGLGLYERICAYAYMLWVIVLAAALFRNPVNLSPSIKH
ncbi:MAG: DUF998 domain-containing protein [Anaerolineae bacterium]|nr:DUF998 domain-containing protein [Anaerolineae bacterium]